MSSAVNRILGRVCPRAVSLRGRFAGHLVEYWVLNEIYLFHRIVPLIEY